MKFNKSFIFALSSLFSLICFPCSVFAANIKVCGYNGTALPLAICRDWKPVDTGHGQVYASGRDCSSISSSHGITSSMMANSAGLYICIQDSSISSSVLNCGIISTTSSPWRFPASFSGRYIIQGNPDEGYAASASSDKCNDSQ